ncbi:lytic transglycosylase [Polymorphobacter multimanifer]|uniref:lytic transglycosylase domain-containing protein n=1 Tax=Polymorphobacter multimanifer TaxID=1070431 RepID=UPI001665024B|nr:lytic transglycosylase domain-containing protein [Polymorphobacter multimanifer]GGI84344.1 lytic transglycosylase [Polymorphobacter multimanifer]
MIRKLLFAAALLSGSAALANDQTMTPPGDGTLIVTGIRDGITARQRAVPAQLTAAERAVWRSLFLDIDAGRLAQAEAALASLGKGLLTETARAQIIAARGPKGVAGEFTRAQLVEWLNTYGDLPQAQGVARVAAQMRGDAGPIPVLPSMRPLRYMSVNPPLAFRSETGETDFGAANALKPLLAADRNADAERAWANAEAGLSSGARAEWAQRVAWSYYGQNDNPAALRLGLQAARGMGPWAALGAWTAGLAAWRLGQYDAAAEAFDLMATRMAGYERTEDLAAAGAYWASRAHLAAGHPELVTPRLESAARAPNSLYGVLARRALGLAPVQDWSEPDFITADWNHLRDFAGARRAAALVEIGQIGLADRELKHLALTAPQANYSALLRLAARLSLPATQYSLAVRPPVGIDPPLSARFPAPDWEPARGWRVDRGLVFAHALQESNFITTATSRAGAKGVMQMMPGTAREVSAAMAAAATEGRGAVIGSLTDPAFNIEVGQTYLEALRDMSYTEGLLPKVIAAYNAGPGSVQRWNASLDDRGDPLLFIASIPFRETRHYVEVVLRNYWMYQLRDGETPASVDALIGGLWPKFPGMPGLPAVKRLPRPVQVLPSQAEPEKLPGLVESGA